MFEQIGAMLTFFLLIVFSMRGAGSRGWGVSLLTAVLSTCGIYVLFVLLLKQQLPVGFLGI